MGYFPGGVEGWLGALILQRGPSKQPSRIVAVLPSPCVPEAQRDLGRGGSDSLVPGYIGVF